MKRFALFDFIISEIINLIHDKIVKENNEGFILVIYLVLKLNLSPFSKNKAI